jgi:hypothetical protein
MKKRFLEEYYKHSTYNFDKFDILIGIFLLYMNPLILPTVSKLRATHRILNNYSKNNFNFMPTEQPINAPFLNIKTKIISKASKVFNTKS